MAALCGPAWARRRRSSSSIRMATDNTTSVNWRGCGCGWCCCGKRLRSEDHAVDVGVLDGAGWRNGRLHGQGEGLHGHAAVEAFRQDGVMRRALRQDFEAVVRGGVNSRERGG